MTTALAGVPWGWTVKMGLLCFVLLRLPRVFRRSKTPIWPGDLPVSLLVGVAAIAVLILLHTSPDGIAVVAAVSLGHVINALVDLARWGWQVRREPRYEPLR
jgi:hypothetical protein